MPTRLSSEPISVGVDRRALIGVTAITGLLTCLAVAGIVVGKEQGAKLLLLVIFAPAFILSLVTVLRRRPILVLESDRLVDVRSHKTVRWDAVIDARLRESKGLLGRVYHQLVITGAPDGRVSIDSIDMLSLPWAEIAKLVEERLPETIPLRRETVPTRRRTTRNAVQ
jgi:hypothetical protein